MPDLLTRATGGSKGFLPCEIVTATTAHCYYCTWGEGLPRPATTAHCDYWEKDCDYLHTATTAHCYYMGRRTSKACDYCWVATYDGAELQGDTVLGNLVGSCPHLQLTLNKCKSLIWRATVGTVRQACVDVM